MTFIPADLSGTTESADKNYFLVTIPDLDLNTAYDIQFAWIYADKTLSDASAKVTYTTGGETINAPSTPVLTADAGMITVAWDGKDYLGNTLDKIKNIDVYIGGIYYGSILRSGAAGRIAIPLKKGTYSVTLKAVSFIGTQSSASTAASISVTYDADEAYNSLLNKLEASADVIANAQNQITSINSSGVVVYASTASATSGNRIVMNSEGLAGFQSGSNTNNPSFAIRINQWTASDGSVIPAGSAYFKGTVNATGGIFTGYVSAGASGMRFGSNVYSSNSGLYIDSNNYWYNTGDFKVGNNTYSLTFDTTKVIVNGEINAESGTIGGANGWTIQSGYLESNGGYIDLGTNGYIVMSSGGYIEMADGGMIDMGQNGAIIMGSTGAFIIQEVGGYFSISESGKDILTVSGVDDGTNGRVVLGDSLGRQVQVAKSATVTGSTTYGTSSRGLRNMFTVQQNYYSSSNFSSDAIDGDVLLVYV